MSSRLRRIAAVHVVLGALLGASASSSCDSAGDVCIPGAQSACPCPGGAIGAQACNAEGSGFETCMCPDVEGGSGEGAFGGQMATGAAPGTGGMPGDGGAPAGGGGSGGDGAGGEGGGTPVVPACYDDGALDYDSPGDETLVGLGRCEAPDIEMFYSSCLAAGSTGATCDAFLSLNEACAGCLLAVGADGTFDGGTPVLIETSDGMYVLANTLACEAAAQGEPQCGGALADLGLCRFTACDTCGNASDYESCFDHASSPESACRAEIYVPPLCEAILDNPVASPQCSGSSFLATYTNIATYFCGSP